MLRLRYLLPLLLLVAGIGVALAESGYQTIQGTRVFTEIDHEAGVATFSNDCGSQKLTQSELQGGAIPTDIIPCPRDGSASNDEGSGDDPEADALFREGLGHKQAERWYEAGKVFGKAALRYGEVGDHARDKTIRSRNLRLFAVSNCLSSLTINLDMLLNSGIPTTTTYGLEDETCRQVEDTSSLVQEIERKLRAVAAANAQRAATEAAQRQAEATQRQAEAERPSDERCAIGIGTTKRVTCVSPGADCECLSFGNTCPYPVTITYQVDNFPTRSFELEGGKNR